MPTQTIAVRRLVPEMWPSLLAVPFLGLGYIALTEEHHILLIVAVVGFMGTILAAILNTQFRSRDVEHKLDVTERLERLESAVLEIQYQITKLHYDIWKGHSDGPEV